jgi:hypothetical protein
VQQAGLAGFEFRADAQCRHGLSHDFAFAEDAERALFRSGCSAACSRWSSPIASRTAASNAVRLSVSPIPSWRSRPRIVFSRATSCDCKALETRNAVLEHRAALDRQILRIVRADTVCRLLMTAPGVGALVSLAFKVAVDDPRRFSRSRDVGAHLGLTPREHSSGELSYHGRISKMGDRKVRRLLYVAASRMLRRDAALWRPLKAWAVRLAQRIGIRKARVHWHANSRSYCTPCGATDRYSSGGALRHRHQRKPRHRPDFLRAHAVPSRAGR